MVHRTSDGEMKPWHLVALLGLMNCSYCHECNSDRSLNVLVGPGVENQLQLAAIDCHSVACVLEGRKREVTREGPTGLRVSTKSGVTIE